MTIGETRSSDLLVCATGALTAAETTERAFIGLAQDSVLPSSWHHQHSVSCAAWLTLEVKRGCTVSTFGLLGKCNPGC